MRFAAGLICALGIFSAAAIAQTGASKSPIQTQFKAFKVHFVGQGKEELEPASSVSPGDVVEYVASHRNVSDKRLLNVDFAIPIPWGTTLWEGSVQPSDGKLEPARKTGQDTQANRDRARVVWRVVRLDPGQAVELKLRVSIDPDPSLAPAQRVNPFAPRKPELRAPG
jgi:uncharacterized repeat protein (TIGR01451 family)